MRIHSMRAISSRANCLTGSAVNHLKSMKATHEVDNEMKHANKVAVQATLTGNNNS